MFVNKKYAFFWFNVQVFATECKNAFQSPYCSPLTVSGSRRRFYSFRCNRVFYPSFGKLSFHRFLQDCRRIFYILIVRCHPLRVLLFFHGTFRIRIQIKAYKNPAISRLSGILLNYPAILSPEFLCYNYIIYSS